MKRRSYDLLVSLGYSNTESKNIIESYPVSNLTDDRLYKYIIDLFSFLDDYYTKEEIRKIIKFEPVIITLSLDNIKKKIKGIISLGYTKEEVIKMIKLSPGILTLNTESMKLKIEDIVCIGYTKEQTMKMLKMFPTLFSYRTGSIKQKINNMVSLGYKKEEVIEMTKVFPSLFGHNIDTIIRKIDDMINLGYTKEEVMKITKSYPAIFSQSTKNIKRKIMFYKSIGLENVILNDSKYLMQSIELSYSRYEYLKEMSIIIDNSNYRKLFYNQKVFKKQFGKDNKELIEMYPFDNYLKVQKYYERIKILCKLNKKESKEIIAKEVKKYIDDNNSINDLINNKYKKILSKKIAC